MDSCICSKSMKTLIEVTRIKFGMAVSYGEKGRRKDSENKALAGTFCFFKNNLLYSFLFVLNVS